MTKTYGIRGNVCGETTLIITTPYKENEKDNYERQEEDADEINDFLRSDIPASTLSIVRKYIGKDIFDELMTKEQIEKMLADITLARENLDLQTHEVNTITGEKTKTSRVTRGIHDIRYEAQIEILKRVIGK